jgi:glycosyltransferase involved in cell wall biosynthesis
LEKILFINQEAGPLLIDMANVFAEKGFDVSVFTGRVIKTSVDLDKRIKVRKLCVYRKNNNFLRVATWVLFFLQVLFCLVVFVDRRTRILFSTNPPFAPWLTLLLNNPSYAHVYDVYPDALLALRWVNKNSYTYKIFAFFNQKAFEKAKMVFTPSEGMKKMLLSATSEEKLRVIPWWADTDFVQPVPRTQNSFLLEHELEDQFIVMYSGNWGLTHNIEKLLEASLELVRNDNIKIVLIGSGPKKQIVSSFVKRNNPKNLLVLPFQNERVLPFSLAAADIAVVLDSFSSLDGEGSTASIPSKTYYLMAAGAVIYAEADQSSELNQLIQRHEIGLCDSSRDVSNFVEFIKLCARNKELTRKLKKNSRDASVIYTRANAKMLFQEIVEASDASHSS